MIGAILGDIIGSAYEVMPIKTKDFELFPGSCGFTDDTVHTVAISDAIRTDADPVDKLHEYYERYPHAGYGRIFGAWAKVKDREPYNSFGNGAAMRISPVGWYYDDLPRVEEHAARLTRITHSHPDGIKAAMAVAGAVFLARTGCGKRDIAAYATRIAGYPLTRTLHEIRPSYAFQVDCLFSVPEAIQCFMESDGVIDAIRNAVSLGGDADTQACIAGSIAEAYYGMPDKDVMSAGIGYLDDFLREKSMAFWNEHVRTKYRRR